MDNIQEKLKKLLRLAQQGVGGEKENAERMLRVLCKKHGIEYETLFEEQIYEFSMVVPNPIERKIFAQTAGRYAKTKKYGSYAQKVYIKTTKRLWLETLEAWSVLLPAYRKEKKRAMEILEDAFIKKHDIYYQNTPEEMEEAAKRYREEDFKPRSAEERRRDFAASSLAGAMDDVHINKQLNKG